MTLVKGERLIVEDPAYRGNVYEVEELTPSFAHGNPARTGTPETYVVALLRLTDSAVVPAEEPSPTAADVPAEGQPATFLPGTDKGGASDVPVPPPNQPESVPATA